MLGRLERVDLRDVWQSEAADFTPWLAGAENLSVLSETLGIDLELEAIEQGVGSFRADVLCRDTSDGSRVLIENQLERTDHTHLGQLITYASGLDTVTIVWIAGRFTEEHRAAMDWLNKITGEGFKFFALEIELWSIADSPIAPKFNIVSKPNDWSRDIARTTSRVDPASLTDAQSHGLAYWTAFAEVLKSRGGMVKATKPHPQNWYQMSIGRTGFNLFANAITTSEPRIAAEVFVSGPDAKKYFDLLERDRSSIDSVVTDLFWQRLPGKKGAKITRRHPSFDPRNQSIWPEQHVWLAEALEQLHSVFAPRVRALNADEWTEDLSPDEDTL